MLVRIANRKQSDLGLHCLSRLFWQGIANGSSLIRVSTVCLGRNGSQLVFEMLEHLLLVSNKDVSTERSY